MRLLARRLYRMPIILRPIALSFHHFAFTQVSGIQGLGGRAHAQADLSDTATVSLNGGGFAAIFLPYFVLDQLVGSQTLSVNATFSQSGSGHWSFAGDFLDDDFNFDDSNSANGESLTIHGTIPAITRFTDKNPQPGFLTYKYNLTLDANAEAFTDGNNGDGTAVVDASHTITIGGASFTDAKGVPIPASLITIESDSGARYQAMDAVLPTIKGDINRDGHVNADDVKWLMAALSDLNAYKSMYNISMSDLQTLCNIDGSVGDGAVIDGVATGITNADVQTLIGLLKSGGGSAVPEPATASLCLIGLILGGGLHIARARQIGK
jgi:hypothetical protein